MKPPLDPIHELTDVENALIDASNYLLEIDSAKEHVRFAPLDTAIDNALRLAQAWIVENKHGKQTGLHRQGD